MTLDELYDQSMGLSRDERLELLCFIITKTVEEVGKLTEDWQKELAGRSAMEIAGMGHWLPSPEFMTKFHGVCVVT